MVSHMCTAMPDFDDTQGLRVGDPRLDGKISLLSLAPYAMNTNEVSDLNRGAVDTSGKPYMPLNFTSMFNYLMPSLPNLNPWCPGGNCQTPKKAGPLEQWSSPYA